MNIKKVIMVILVFLTFINYPAKAENIQLETQIGYGGYVFPGKWVPLKIKLSGKETASEIEVVRLLDQRQYSVERFSSLINNQIECPVYLNEAISGLKVRLNKNSHYLAEQTINIQAKTFPGHLVLVVNLSPKVQQAIENSLLPSEPVLVITSNFNELPALGLDYDAVSGLVITDPGPVLNPGQIQALRIWLSSGGKMVINAAHPQNESIIKTLVPDNQRSGISDKDVIKIGWGKITIFRSDINEMEKENISWKSILDLEPYKPGVGFTIGKFLSLPDSRFFKEMGSLSVNYLKTTLIIWALICLLIVLFIKRRYLLYLFLFSILFIIAAFPLGSWLDSTWQRGAGVYCRALVLPDSGGILINSITQIVPNELQTYIQNFGSPWGVTISSRNDYGQIRPGIYSSWNHQTNIPAYTIRSATDKMLDLVGWIPAPLFEPSNINFSNVLLWKENQWWFRTNDSSGQPYWEKSAKLPKWLQREIGWLKRLQRLTPEKIWLVGQGSLPEVEIKLQNGIHRQLFWVIPLGTEEIIFSK